MYKHITISKQTYSLIYHKYSTELTADGQYRMLLWLQEDRVEELKLIFLSLTKNTNWYKFIWIRDCLSESRMFKGVSFQHRLNCSRTIYPDWEIQLLVIGLVYGWLHEYLYKSLEVKTDHITQEFIWTNTTIQIAFLTSESVHEIEKKILPFEIQAWKGHD